MFNSISLLFAFAAVVAVQAATLRKFDVLDKALDAYDKRVIPSADKATDIEVSMYITRLYEFNEVDKSFNADIYFRQSWIDPRLAFTPNNESDRIRLDHYLTDRIWTPDTFFSLSHRDALNSVTTPNVFVSIEPSGKVFTSGRYSLNVPCIKLDDNDQLECSILAESYGFSMDDINYKWKSAPPQDKVEWEMGKYKFVSLQQKEKEIKLSSGTYKQLIANIVIEKK